MVQRRIRRTVLSTVLAIAAVLLGSTAVTAQAAPAPTQYYLALGDSVAFGYAPPDVTPPQWYLQPSRFRGYPEDLALQLGLHDVNASCPGETTSSFLDTSAVSNGCENSPTSDTGYRDVYPLHVNYPNSQMAFAKHFLMTKGASTQLVSINIGANDIFVCQETTPDQCTGADFQTTLNTIAQNLATTLGTIRGTGYTGNLVVLAYYAISYTDPIQVAGTKLLNQVLGSVAAQFNAVVPDGFTAFQKIAARAGNNPCTAGLLIQLPTGDCNIHPSALGHNVLAHTIANALS